MDDSLKIGDKVRIVQYRMGIPEYGQTVYKLGEKQEGLGRQCTNEYDIPMFIHNSWNVEKFEDIT